jgi:pimeloyl-ACP methyl ester carboxylesterase
MDATSRLRDGRTLAWHEWGVPDGTPLLRLQGTPGSRLDRSPHPERWERHRVRVLVADPLAAFRGIMAKAPPGDRELLEDPAWQAVVRESVPEALRQGAEGWTDEMLRIFGDWHLAPEEVITPVVWWHGRRDANAPIAAVERFTARMPSVELRIWDGGHLDAHRHEEEILDDLLHRPAAATTG